jgi:hypothetical protein
VNNSTKWRKINMTNTKNVCTFIFYCETKYRSLDSMVSIETRLQDEQSRI